jgi:RHS repeat-associated protein
MKTFSRSLLITLAFWSVVSPSRAQVGNDNPTGPAGIFNGEITTGGSYDPYTGNVRRAVIDIAVAGAVGTNPLTFSRVCNSRNAIWGINFGFAGSWVHNYEWTINDSNEALGPQSPASYTVYFPDGRYEVFQHSSTDTYYRAALGTSERFIPLNTSTLLAYLILADGGKVEFKATLNTDVYIADNGRRTTYYYYSYVAQALIDRYGLRTTFTYDSNGNLQQITEPAGRYIQLSYINFGGTIVIDHVTASDGRTVQYSYIQTTFPPNTNSTVCLDHVVYYGDSTLTARYTYRYSNVPGYNIPLLSTADDPMYTGPMKRIAYVYQTANNGDGSAPTYGQLQSENYYDGTHVGAAVSTLTITGTNTRTETRGDGPARNFNYGTPPFLADWSDFAPGGVLSVASVGHDGNGFVNSYTDFNRHTTNYARDPHTGAITQIMYPATPEDAPGGRGTVNYTWVAPCSGTNADPNNCDPNNPYYLYSATDEAGNPTFYFRDGNRRVTQINYPDGGVEGFAYDYDTHVGNLGQVVQHRLTTGGLETYTYDGRGLKQTYRDPDNASGNPTAWYKYDSLDRVSDVTDTLGSALGDPNHTTSYTYNLRGQVLTTTHPVDPIDNQRHTITNIYYPDGSGTLANVVDELGHVTSYTYDDYKRVTSVTDPLKQTTSYNYTPTSNTSASPYTHTTNSNFWQRSPMGKYTAFWYDQNFRRITLYQAAWSSGSDQADTSYYYDPVGNLTSVISPNEQSGQPYVGQHTVTTYDERNRIASVTDPLGNVTSYTYDAAGRKASITRANGQVTTYDVYDAMNRLQQQTIHQSPSPDAVTAYRWETSGLLGGIRDPHLNEIHSTDSYDWAYDLMGRKIGFYYPPNSGGVHETWHYDVAGRNDTFTNRAGNVQRITYDALNRKTGFSWNDNGLTPSVTFGYDVASRMTSVVNANATISRTYFDNNLLKTETTTYADNTPRTVTYTYNTDGTRATIQYPNGAYSFTYNYTNRNQLQTVVNNSGNATVITYGYDLDGNLKTRTPANGTSSSYIYDGLDRVTHIRHALNGTTRTFDYGYDSVSNRTWTKRDGGSGDIFGYDLNDQVTATKLDIANPDTTPVGPQTIVYDANGNRTTFSAYGPTDTYTTNNLNQYTARNSSNAAYDNDGNMTSGLGGSTYTYDAQNRLLTAFNGAGTMNTFKYDGLNRQVSRKVGGGGIYYRVYDGWDLLGEYAAGSTSAFYAYVYGAGGVIQNLVNNHYYYQDASGSTTHLANSAGTLIEWYRYDLQGKPVFYNASNNQINGTAYGVRHLFTGQQWYSEIGLYDLRNRFYSPDAGRFLQGDPIGFRGDATNLYRFCGNNPLNRIDPSGLQEEGDAEAEAGAPVNYYEFYPSFYYSEPTIFRSSTTINNIYMQNGLGASQMPFQESPIELPPGDNIYQPSNATNQQYISAAPPLQPDPGILFINAVGNYIKNFVNASFSDAPLAAPDPNAPPQAQPSGPPPPRYQPGSTPTDFRHNPFDDVGIRLQFLDPRGFDPSLRFDGFFDYENPQNFIFQVNLGTAIGYGPGVGGTSGPGGSGKSPDFY